MTFLMMLTDAGCFVCLRIQIIIPRKVRNSMNRFQMDLMCSELKASSILNTDELLICTKGADACARNYHAWVHRQYVVRHFAGANQEAVRSIFVCKLGRS